MTGKLSRPVLRGPTPGNGGRLLGGIVTLMRTRYDATAAIILRVAAGFFDEKNFALWDDLGIGFVATGKVYEAIKQKVRAIPTRKWKEYEHERQVWSYARLSYKREKWTRSDRAYDRCRLSEARK